MTDILARIRNRLREERIARGVPMEAIALACDPPVKRGAVFKWESGENQLPIRALEAYESALGVPIDIFVGGTRDALTQLDARRVAIADECIGALASIPEDELDAFRVMLRAFRH